MRKIVDSDVVVADLTSHNPNVMYELAIRHAIKKPAIIMIKSGEKIPFDIANERTIIFDKSDIASVDNARDKLAEQARSVLSNEFIYDTPFSFIESISSVENIDRGKIDNWTIALDDLGFIKNSLKQFIAWQLEVENVKDTRVSRLTDPFVSNNWIKISVEFPGPRNTFRGSNVEISAEHTLSDVLDKIYFMLRDDSSSTFHPKAYTYLYDWILIRKKDFAPFIHKGYEYQIKAIQFFVDGETWQVRKLDKPLLNNPERFGIIRGKKDHIMIDPDNPKNSDENQKSINRL